MKVTLVTLFTASFLSLVSALPALEARDKAHKYKLVLKTAGNDPTIDQFNGFTGYRNTDQSFGGSLYNRLTFHNGSASPFKLDSQGHLSFYGPRGLQLDGISEGDTSPVEFVKGAGDSTVFVAKKGKEMYVKSNKPDFGYWVYFISQYGSELMWADKSFNVTAYNAELPVQDRAGVVTLLVELI
jgi:hypothetical protein